MNKKLAARLKAAHGYYHEDKVANNESKLLQTQSEGFLVPEEGEKTTKVTQKMLKNLVPTYNSSLIFDLSLSFGGYYLDYTKNGSFLVLGGQQGHVSLIKWREAKLVTEFHTKELIRDIKFLQNELMFAVAQRKCIYIYDNQGIEIHCLRNHIEPQKIEYLPYHFLLVSSNNHGYLKYLDISTGKPVSEHRFHFENVNDMKQNPWNSVIGVADGRGLVTMWTPNINKPVVRLVSHNGPCTQLAVDIRGLYLASSGADNKVKIYDLRSLSDPLYEYWTKYPCSSLEISQTGLLGVAELDTLKIWKDWQITKQKIPYMEHVSKSPVIETKFVPYEDFLGLGTRNGFSNLCIPGSGIANYDTFEANPFINTRQRQEQEVKALLDKLPPSTIVVNPHDIGVIDKAQPEVIDAELKAQQAEQENKIAEKKAKKRKRKEEKHKKLSVHEKKTREKIQNSFREKEKNKIEANLKAAKDINFLNEITSDILGMPKKKPKTTDI